MFVYISPANILFLNVCLPHHMRPQKTIQLLLCIILVLQKHMINAIPLGNATDQLALLEFKSHLASSEILNMWNESVPHCQWPGVMCGHKHQRVIALDLMGHNLFGPIAPDIGNLSFLRHIGLSTNKLNGEIPQEIGGLSRLRFINLTANTLEGTIPANLSYCTKLNLLVLRKNNLRGEIPMGLGYLKKLVSLNLSDNKLSGEIPSSLGNLSSLQSFFVAVNNLQGSIPNEFGKLANMAVFAIALNNISGLFPPSLFNISSITGISTAENLISGNLPNEIGFILPNLRILGIGGNLFTGTIPKSLGNASQLTVIDLAGNGFVGQIPHSLGSLPGLQFLGLGSNKLGGDPTEDLSFIEPLSNCTILTRVSFAFNNMTGKLPNSIANLSVQVEGLYMGNNNISGTIPESMGNLINLYFLAMGSNKLSGVIPSSLGKLTRLQRLYLNQNLLSGEIPSSLGNLIDLSELNLAANKLVGGIPESIGNCSSMQFLSLSNNNLSGIIPPRIMEIASFSELVDLSYNGLNGSLPAEVGKLVFLRTLDISHNNLSGEIPSVIGSCISLESLDLSGNIFEGTIPYTLPNMISIQSLDLSQNRLSGKIPEGIENLAYLKYLNLSLNNIEGEIPTSGVFGNVSAISVAGNRKLCGGVPQLELPPCTKTEANRNHKLTIALVCVALFLLAITLFGVLYWRKKKMKVSVASLEEDKLMRISYWELQKATNGFSSENSIGSGSFGTVYKGKLNKQVDNFVAVKVLNLQNSRASKSFIAECKILRSIRHRNLVKILTYCSSIDSKHDEFKALIYEYMPNGNLDMWLHPDEASNLSTLNLDQRLNIAIDVASALHYLHNDCEPRVIHCDVKPSNILLDDEMCAYVGDFGLARFLPKSDGIVSETSSIGVKGTIGYAAPEYGTGGETSTQGDVYAYGILLLEMITGKRPTEVIFKDEFNLHNYVKNVLPRHVLEIVDPVLRNEQQEGSGETERRETEIVETSDRDDNVRGSSHWEFEKNIIEILNIALACSEESPTNRIEMNHVINELHRVKSATQGNLGNGL